MGKEQNLLLARLETLFWKPFMKYLTQSRLYADGLPGVGLLFLRIFAGYAMAQHGLGKIANPFGWMGPEGPPGFLQALAAISEFGGGIALVFGALFPLACLGVMCTMFVASLSNLNGGAPIVASGPGPSAEASILYFVIALAFFLTGPGLLSIDYFLFGRKRAVTSTS